MLPIVRHRREQTPTAASVSSWQAAGDSSAPSASWRTDTRICSSVSCVAERVLGTTFADFSRENPEAAWESIKAEQLQP